VRLRTSDYALKPKVINEHKVLALLKASPGMPEFEKRELLRQLPEDRQAAIHYLETGVRLGCPEQQLVNFITAGIWLQPKQLEMASAARACDYRCPECEAKYKAGRELPVECAKCGPVMVGFGGARGGAKSHFMFSQICADDCQRYPGLKVLYLRKSVTAAWEQIRGLLRTVCPGIPHKTREQAGIIDFPNGSYVIVKHFKDEKDIENFIGQEYDVIAIEELTTLTKTKFEDLKSCCRSSKVGWRPRIYAAWNWGGVGHFFVMRLFYEPWEQKRQIQTRYILARVTDNRHNNPEYVNTLKSYTGWKRKSWLEGDPHFQAGQFFTTWSEKDHVLKAFDERKIVRWIGGFDYGRTHPTVFLLAGEDKEGNLIFLDEHSKSQTDPRDHAISIYAMLRPRNLRPSDLDFIAAGRDCFSAKETGETIADMYDHEGIPLVEAEIDRINGWAKFAARLGDPEKGFKPTLFVHERCQNLISQIPIAQHDEKRPEDVEKMDASPEDDTGGDDALDCARFVISTSPGGAMRFCQPVALSAWAESFLIGNGG
jgi:phage terminase large subunit